MLLIILTQQCSQIAYTLRRISRVVELLVLYFKERIFAKKLCDTNYAKVKLSMKYRWLL